MGKIWISGGEKSTDLDLVTASAVDVRLGKVIVDMDGNPVTGAMPETWGTTITPQIYEQRYIGNCFLLSDIIVPGAPGMTPQNIRNGVNLFGVIGNMLEYKVYTVDVNVGHMSMFLLTGGQQFNAWVVDVSGFNFTPAGYTAVNMLNDRYTSCSSPEDGIVLFSRDGQYSLSARVNNLTSVWAYNHIIVPIMGSGTTRVRIFGY